MNDRESERPTIEEHLRQCGVSRRSFLQLCTALLVTAPLLVLSNPNNDRPLMTLDVTRVTQGFWTSALPDGFSTTLSILASGKTPGVLQPGESVTVPVYYAGLQQPWDFSHTTIPFNLGVITTTDATAINWNALEAGLRPSWIASVAWDPIFRSVVAQADISSEVFGVWNLGFFPLTSQ